MWVIGIRCEACRACPHATRNPAPKYKMFGGLTTKSVCEKQRELTPDKPALIIVGTAVASASCPLGLWGNPLPPVELPDDGSEY